jgi:hypothetical protein
MESVLQKSLAWIPPSEVTLVEAVIAYIQFCSYIGNLSDAIGGLSIEVLSASSAASALLTGLKTNVVSHFKIFCAGRRVIVAATWPTALILSALQGVFDPKSFYPFGTLRAPRVGPLEGQDGRTLSYLQVPVQGSRVALGWVLSWGPFSSVLCLTSTVHGTDASTLVASTMKGRCGASAITKAYR